jgi:hypothetical protein
LSDGDTRAAATSDPNALHEKPLAEACGFLSFNTLIEKVEAFGAGVSWRRGCGPTSSNNTLTRGAPAQN